MWLLAAALLVVAAAGLCTFVVLKLLTPRVFLSPATRIKEAADPQRASGDESRHESVAESGAAELVDSPKEWWVNADYFWVVLCKNERFHFRVNPCHAHRIPLGQTDSVLPNPVKRPFKVRCDSCAKEYAYVPSDVLRWEMAAPEHFQPHPLFRD